MNIFPLRRRDAALSALRLPEAVFRAVEETPEEPVPVDTTLPADDPEEPTELSPANELVTALVALDIAEAIRADAPAPEPLQMPAPLSQRHLETIDRMVAHLRTSEQRLREQIADARRQLADTRLARRGFERNSAELRRGIAVMVRRADTEGPMPTAMLTRPIPTAALQDLRPSQAGDDPPAASTRDRRGMH